jgi:probable phosphoglycerate mutase
MRLTLIRHGQTPSNVLGLLDTGHPGPVLTELGLRQAAAIPGALSGHPIDGIFVSTLIRTQLTAAPLARDRGIVARILPGLHEISAGSLELNSDRESVLIYLQTMAEWGSGERSVVMPGAHDGHAFFERFDADIAAIEAEGIENAVVVSHGAAIRVWVAGRAANIEPSYTAHHDLGNTGVVMLEGTLAQGFALVSWEGHAIGGAALDDPAAPDPTGETIDDALGQ